MPSEILTPFIGLLGALIGAAVAYFVAKRQTDAQIEMAHKSASTNLAIAQETLQAENRLAYASYEAIRRLLLQKEWELRSFEAIKKHLPAFEDNELRRLLVAASAVCFQESGTGRELWGLLERNADKLAPPPSQTILKAAVVAPALSPPPFPQTAPLTPVAFSHLPLTGYSAPVAAPPTALAPGKRPT